MRLVQSLLVGVLMVATVGGAAGAQSFADIRAGAQLRLTGDRPTNDRIEHFSLQGVLVGADYSHIMLRHDEPPRVDTVALIGVRRLQLLDGYHSRSSLIFTGAAVGLITGTVMWLGARQLADPEEVTTHLDAQNQEISVKQPASLLTFTKKMIPILGASGFVVGATIGREHWVTISVPISIFEQKP